jgi:uncharacterized protein YjiS (DUF1127 family)
MTGLSVHFATVRQSRAKRSEHSFLNRVASLLRRLGERYQAATALQQLESMSDWQLKDVGIDRCGIRHGFSLRSARGSHARD